MRTREKSHAGRCWCWCSITSIESAYEVGDHVIISRKKPTPTPLDSIGQLRLRDPVSACRDAGFFWGAGRLRAGSVCCIPQLVPLCSLLRELSYGIGMQ